MADLQLHIPILATQTYQPDGAVVKHFRDTNFDCCRLPIDTEGCKRQEERCQKAKKVAEKNGLA
jgi:hypothetical protein